MTSKPIAYNGVIHQGPLAGRTLAQASPKKDVEGGMYIWMSARGPSPAYWKWLPKKSEAGK